LIGWFFQFAFAATATATAATIVAGTVAERCKFEAYIAYSLMLTGLDVYPVVVYSIWSSSGFLSAFTDNKFFDSGTIDFAGSGVVHTTGGATALFAAKILDLVSGTSTMLKARTTRACQLPSPLCSSSSDWNLHPLGRMVWLQPWLNSWHLYFRLRRRWLPCASLLP